MIVASVGPVERDNFVCICALVMGNILYRHDPAIYCGVGEGAASIGQSGNAYPSYLPNDDGHEFHAIVRTLPPGQ